MTALHCHRRPAGLGLEPRRERHIERAQRCALETKAVRTRARWLGIETTQPSQTPRMKHSRRLFIVTALRG